MGSGVSTYLRILVTEEMRRRVSSAARGGEALSVLSSAAEIAQAFPGSDLSVDEVANQLCAEATRAGVAVELGRGRAPVH